MLLPVAKADSWLSCVQHDSEIVLWRIWIEMEDGFDLRRESEI